MTLFLEKDVDAEKLVYGGGKISGGIRWTGPLTMYAYCVYKNGNTASFFRLFVFDLKRKSEKDLLITFVRFVVQTNKQTFFMQDIVMSQETLSWLIGEHLHFFCIMTSQNVSCQKRPVALIVCCNRPSDFFFLCNLSWDTGEMREIFSL